VQDLDRIYVYVDKFRSNQQLANLGKSQKDVILASIVRTTDYYCKLNNVESQKLTEFFDSDLRWFTNYGARFNGLDDKVKNALLRSGSGIMSMGRGCSPASISGYFDRITNGDFSGRKDSAPPAQIFDALSNLDVQNLDQKLVNRSIATLLDYERLRSKEQFSIAASYLGSLFSQPKFHSLSDNLKGDLISLAGLEPILRSPSDINVVKFLSDLAHDKDFWNIDPTKIELLVDKFRAIAFLGKKKGGYSDDNAGWKLGQPADVIDSKSMDILGYAVNYKKEPLMARLEELLADRWPKLRNPEFIPDQFSEYFKLTTNEKFQRVRIGNNVSLSVGGGAPSVDSFTEVVHFSDGHSIMMALPKDHSWNKEEETDLPSVQMILSRIAEAPKDYRHALRYVVVEPNSKLSFSDTGTKTAMLADLEKSQLEIFPLPTNEHGAFTFSTEMAIWHELAHLATLTGPKQFTRRDFAEWRKAIKDDRASVSKYSAEATKESQGYDPIFEDIADAGAIYAAASLQQTDKLYKVAKFLYGNRLRILERKYGQLKFSTPVEKESDE
jgi:predicted SprT family Zn-dependent metalloprotease